MSFLDDVANEAKPKGPTCSIRAWLETQDTVTNDDLRAGVEIATLAAVTRALRNRGFKTTPGSLKRHVNGECACPTS